MYGFRITDRKWVGSRDGGKKERDGILNTQHREEDTNGLTDSSYPSSSFALSYRRIGPWACRPVGGLASPLVRYSLSLRLETSRGADFIAASVGGWGTFHPLPFTVPGANALPRLSKAPGLALILFHFSVGGRPCSSLVTLSSLLRCLQTHRRPTFYHINCKKLQFSVLFQMRVIHIHSSIYSFGTVECLSGRRLYGCDYLEPYSSSDHTQAHPHPRTFTLTLWIGGVLPETL